MKKIIEGLRNAREKTELHLFKSRLLKEGRRLKRLEERLEEREKEIGKQAIYEAKEVQFYGQATSAFLNNRMEKDKSILSLSVVGIGYLVSFAKPTDSSSVLSCIEKVFLSIGAVFFFLTVFIILMIFKWNTDYIQAILAESKDENCVLKKLKRYDHFAFTTFVLGIIFTMLLGSTAIS